VVEGDRPVDDAAAGEGLLEVVTPAVVDAGRRPAGDQLEHQHRSPAVPHVEEHHDAGAGHPLEDPGLAAQCRPRRPAGSR